MRALPFVFFLVAATAAPAFAQAVPPAGAAACGGCHGAPGLALPSLDALKAGEITAAMSAFRAGTREATVMDRISKGFSEAETEAIAQWLANGGSKK